MLDENHGSAPKCDQETDVHSILKRVRWNYDGDIQRKEDAWELQTAEAQRLEKTTVMARTYILHVDQKALSSQARRGVASD